MDCVDTDVLVTETKLIGRFRAIMENWPIFRLESERSVLEHTRRTRGVGRQQWAQLQAIKLVISGRKIMLSPYFEQNPSPLEMAS